MQFINTLCSHSLVFYDHFGKACKPGGITRFAAENLLLKYQFARHRVSIMRLIVCLLIRIGQ